MSLHAQLSPEAQARLDSLRRNSSISSIVSGILGVVLIGMVAALIGLDVLVKTTPTIITYEPPDRPETKPDPNPLTNRVQPKPAAPSRAMPRVFVANTSSPTSISVPVVEVSEPSTDYGTGDDFGEGYNGDGDGKPKWQSFRRDLSKRCSQADRLQRLQENGGTDKCEEAVVKGLDWLRNTQSKDGSWGGSNKPAMTGLALLAYLGHCETPVSEKYGDSVLRGLIYLVDLGMHNNGKLIAKGGEKEKHWPYEHSIATYALAEATTFCEEFGVTVPNLREVTQQAGQYIIDNQHSSGGWDYSYSEDSTRGGDLSVSAWHVQALKACKHTGLDFRNMRKCVSKATEYVIARQDSGGGFGYSGTGSAGGTGYHTLTGAGMLCLQMWDKGSHSGVRNGARYIQANSKFDYNTEFCDLYGHYYESQAMMNRGGVQWKFYNQLFRDQVLDNQADDGSWKTCGGGQKPRAVAASYVGNTHYRSCLCILMLEVYYRFLPGTGGA